MKKSLKGTLLSGFVYPGVGQIYLGQKGIGAVFIILTTAILTILIYRITERVRMFIEIIIPAIENSTLDMDQYNNILSYTVYSNLHPEIIYFVSIILCWLAATVHAYVIGGRQDRSEGKT